MRNTKARFYLTEASRPALLRGLRLAFVAAGIGLVMTASPVRAGDDDDGDGDDGLTFEERIVDNLMTGLGAKSAASKGINYRERSPLVVPPKLDLPPPASAAKADAPNWPKDPDLARRKAAIEARKKEVKKEPWQQAMPLTQAEIEAGRKQQTATNSKDPIEPGVTTNPSLMPNQLGYTGGLMGMFKGNSSESAPFKGEPTRQSLTEPPSGYQTPSSNFAYGTGPMKPLVKEGEYDIQTGKPIQ